MQKPELPEGFTEEVGLAYGSRMEGLLEIAYFNHKKKNASTAQSHLKMAKLIPDAQKDE